MSRPIGYYVHHHGDGHRQRAMAIAQAAGGRVTLLGTGLGTGLADRCGGIDVVDLPDDRLSDAFDAQDDGPRPAALHYAPIDHDGVRQRTARVTDWIAHARPALMVIDVSVEIAMLARLASTPTVYVRLNGNRRDRPHLEAYRGAAGLLAPFHEALDDASTPPGIRCRTFYAPGIVVRASAASGSVDILGVVGRGSGASDGALWADAARATPGRRWQVIGPCAAPDDLPPNLTFHGWVDDADARIAGANIVVGAAGDGLVGSVIAARRPFVCLPEPRPFDEQLSKADRLAAAGAAIVRHDWPAGTEWPGLIERATALDSAALAALDMPDGAARAARWLCDLADRTSQPKAPA